MLFLVVVSYCTGYRYRYFPARRDTGIMLFNQAVQCWLSVVGRVSQSLASLVLLSTREERMSCHIAYNRKWLHNFHRKTLSENIVSTASDPAMIIALSNLWILILFYSSYFHIFYTLSSLPTSKNFKASKNSRKLVTENATMPSILAIAIPVSIGEIRKEFDGGDVERGGGGGLGGWSLRAGR